MRVKTEAEKLIVERMMDNLKCLNIEVIAIIYCTVMFLQLIVDVLNFKSRYSSNKDR